MQTLQNKYQRHHSYHQCMPYDVKSVLPTVMTWSSSESNLLRTHKEKCECWGKIPKWKRIHRKNRGLRILWNVPIKTSTKLPYNKPDTHLEQKKQKTCSVIEISWPADVKYPPLLRNLQLMYNDCRFEMISITIGAFRFASNDLKISLGNLNFDKKETKSLIRKLQTITVSGTVKIVETIIRFKMWSGP